MTYPASLQEYEADYRALLTASSSLQLATCDANGDAEISYAPFLCKEGNFYVFVSTLARHTGNMLRTAQASVLIIQPEAEVVNPFARRRLTFNCRVTEISKDDQEYQTVLDAMQNRLGNIVGLLRSLPDFHLMALSPRQGAYVAGFGKAFKIDVDGGKLLQEMT